MKKSTIVLSSFASLTILLGACTNESKPDDKGASKIESDNKSNKKDNKSIKKSEKVATDDFDISSQKFIDEFTKEKGRGFRGIEPGMTYAEVKSKLGNPTKYGFEDMTDFGGFRFYFNNFILVFEDVNKKSEIKDDSKVKYVFLQNKEATPVEEFGKAWGTHEEFIPFNHGSIGSNIYEVNGKTINGFFSHGVIEFVSKENLKKIFDESQDKTYKDDGDKTLTEINGVTHYNVPDLLSEEFANSIKENTFNIGGVGLLKKSDGKTNENLKPGQEQSVEGKEVYDNFIFHLYAGTGKAPEYPVAQIDLLDLAYQKVTIDELIESWNLEKLAFDGGNFKIFNLDNGTYVTFKYYNDSKFIHEINLNEGQFSELAGLEEIQEDENSNAEGSNDYTSKEFAYEILSNSYRFHGIKAGDQYTMEEVIERAGEPTDYPLGYLIYEDEKVEVDTYDGYVSSISLDLTDAGVNIDDLKSGWNENYEDAETDRGLETIYDNNKTNGYYVVVESKDGVVQYIRIYGHDKTE